MTIRVTRTIDQWTLARLGDGSCRLIGYIAPYPNPKNREPELGVTSLVSYLDRDTHRAQSETTNYRLLEEKHRPPTTVRSLLEQAAAQSPK